jgi:diacylglycerol kinase family enzyme
MRNYRAKPPTMALEVAGERVDGVSAMVQNSDPFTYFGSRPLRLCDDISFDNGFLSAMIMRRATTLDAPGVLRHLFSRNGRLAHHRRARGFTRVEHARILSLDGRRLPIEVDGDYIGTGSEFVYEAAPGALLFVA